jgi:hypothetical protein
MMVELHPRTCACHGGSWMSIAGQSGSPCSKDGRLPPGALVVPLEQWRAMGKPHTAEEFREFLGRLSRYGDRREFERFEVAVGVKLSRLDNGTGLSERTSTENMSRGGARVATRLSAERGDVILFEEAQGAFRTRAQVQEVTGEAARDRRLHLRFLDGLAPDGLFARAMR